MGSILKCLEFLFYKTILNRERDLQPQTKKNLLLYRYERDWEDSFGMSFKLIYLKFYLFEKKLNLFKRNWNLCIWRKLNLILHIRYRTVENEIQIFCSVCCDSNHLDACFHGMANGSLKKMHSAYLFAMALPTVQPTSIYSVFFLLIFYRTQKADRLSWEKAFRNKESHP